MSVFKTPNPAWRFPHTVSGYVGQGDLFCKMSCYNLEPDSRGQEVSGSVDAACARMVRI